MLTKVRSKPNPKSWRRDYCPGQENRRGTAADRESADDVDPADERGGRSDRLARAAGHLHHRHVRVDASCQPGVRLTSDPGMELPLRLRQAVYEKERYEDARRLCEQCGDAVQRLLSRGEREQAEAFGCARAAGNRPGTPGGTRGSRPMQARFEEARSHRAYLSSSGASTLRRFDTNL